MPKKDQPPNLSTIDQVGRTHQRTKSISAKINIHGCQLQWPIDFAQAPTTGLVTSVCHLERQVTLKPISAADRLQGWGWSLDTKITQAIVFRLFAWARRLCIVMCSKIQLLSRLGDDAELSRTVLSVLDLVACLWLDEWTRTRLNGAVLTISKWLIEGYCVTTYLSSTSN